MNRLRVGIGLALALAACNDCKRNNADQERPSGTTQASQGDNAHEDRAHDGHQHREGDGHDHSEQGEHEDHGHTEVDLGTVTMGDMEVACAQGHGKVEAGKESHLVVKLPYNDKGATAVRAWIGTSDRTLSFVGKGEYAAAHDDYDVHAIAPQPLPEEAMWWIEIEKPDGTKLVGSVKPILD